MLPEVAGLDTAAGLARVGGKPALYLRLLQQFHDIRPGTSIGWVHREAMAEYERIRAAAEDLIAQALAHLTGAGDTVLTVNPAAVRRA